MQLSSTSLVRSSLYYACVNVYVDRVVLADRMNTDR
jgi:hypothetical protein